MFVDASIVRLLLKFINHCGGPAILLQNTRTASRQRLSETNTFSCRFVQMKLVRRHVLKIWTIATIDPNHWNARRPQRGEKFLQRLNCRPIRD